MNWYFFGWRDAAEILFFTTSFYYFSIWLKADKQKKLLGFFYCYCFIIIGAYYLQLATLHVFLLCTAPIVLMLFIVVHQHILQRNFVTLRNIKPATVDSGQWLEILLRSCLIALNHGKELLCIIEHNDNLQDTIDIGIPFNTFLHAGLLEVLTESTAYDAHKILLCTTRGTIVGINAQWNTTINKIWQRNEINKLPTWQQEAVAMTNHTDAIVLKADQTTHTFTIIIKSTLYTDVDVHNTLKLISTYIRGTIPSDYQGARYHGTHTQKNSIDQHHA